MKLRGISWLVAAALVLGACGKKEAVKAPQEAAPVTEAPVAAPPAVVAPPTPAVPAVVALPPEERAAKLGFAGLLSQDTGAVMSFYQANRIINRIKSGKLWTLSGLPPAADAEKPAAVSGPAALFEKEFTIALGKQVGDQTGNLLTLNRRMGYLQMRGLARAMAEAARAGDDADIATSMSRYNMEMMTGLLADPEAGIALFEKMEMPPLYLAFRAATPEMIKSNAQQLVQLTEFLGMLGEVVEPVEIEKSGKSFAGYKILGAKVSESMAKNRADMEEHLDPAMIDRLLAAIAKLNLVVLSGTLGDHAILFIGSSADDLNFAPAVGESLTAGDSLAFCDANASKDLVALTYVRQDALKQMIDAAGGFSDMVDGLRDGLAESEGLGDTRDIEALLRMVSERETAMRALAKTEGGGMIAFLEDGLKIESYGGTDSGAVDWSASNKLASLGDSENTALFLNATGDAAYDEKAKACFEAVIETAYALAMKTTELPLQGPDMNRFKEMAGLFDKKFRPDAVLLWDALRGDASAGLGAETALVVDLNGSVPTVPGLPQELVDKAKFPRVSLVAPVTDRAKLASAWQGVNRGATGIIAGIGEMNGKEIPMQKPISSEKNGFTTWFFPLPFFNDDFVPSVTVGDEWFAASTSKNQALDLLAKAGKGEARGGLYLALNFQALRVFTSETLDLIAKHPDALPLDPNDMEQLRNLATALEDFDKLTAHSRRDNGVLRTSIHLKTR
jgi:hypothetical protein